jgi:hypothetical protein
VVELGVNQFGDKVTTLTIEWGSKREGTSSTSTGDDTWKGRGGKLLRSTLTLALDRDGTDYTYTPTGCAPIRVRAVDLEAVRPKFYKEYFVDAGDAEAKKAAKQKAFKRAVVDACEDGHVGTDENALGRTMIWLVNPPPRGGDHQ